VFKICVKKCRQASGVGKIGLGGFVIPSRMGRNLFFAVWCYPYSIPHGIKNVVWIYNQLIFGHCTPIVIGAKQPVQRCKRGTEEHCKCGTT
jgi:hypothetical protein